MQTTRFALIAIVIVSKAAQAQRPDLGPVPELADSSPARIFRTANGSFPSNVVVEVLRQRQQAYASSKRAEIADSTTARVINSPTAAAGNSALIALSLSGNANPGLGGVPDRDVLNRLIQIHKSARTDETRVDALLEVVHQVDPTRAFPYLRDVAMSADDRSAQAALFDLKFLAFPASPIGTSQDRAEAAAVLRHLYDVDSLKSGLAIVEICEIGARLAWPRSAKCRPGA